MAEVHLIGRIDSAVNFPSPSMYCAWKLVMGGGWRVVDGLIQAGFPSCPGGFMATNWCQPLAQWRQRFTDWLGDLGHLDAPPLRDHARSTASALTTGQFPPRFSESLPTASLADAYAAQRRLVRTLATTDPTAGFKGAAASAAAQKSLGIDGPLASAVFRSGRLDGRSPQTVPLRPGQPIVVETEIGPDYAEMAFGTLSGAWKPTQMAGRAEIPWQALATSEQLNRLPDVGVYDSYLGAWYRR